MRNFDQYDLKSYIKVFKSFVDPNHCDFIAQQSPSYEWHKHLYNDTSDNKIQYENDLDICLDEFQGKQLLHESLWYAIKQYQNEFNYSWFNSWTGYSRLRLNRYNTGTEMRIHFDNITSLFDGEKKGSPLLSIVGSLNDNYTGGDFVFFEDFKIELNKGDVIIFPSSFMYPHKVTPVTSNFRLSFVSWVY
jgi:hypothetical protein